VGRQLPAATTKPKASEMAKDMVISTSRVNCYGYRVLTEGINIEQYQKNPVLLYMHNRGVDVLPIGRVENLRFEGDRLIGTPVFDENDPFAKQIADKWERGFLRMCSPSLELIEKSDDPAMLLQGQTRPTVTQSILTEVSIVDIGGNDDALQLLHNGAVLKLSAGQPHELLPLLELSAPKNENVNDNADTSANINTKNSNMKKETLELLGLSENATEQEIHERIKLLKENADKAKQLELSMVEREVDAAIADKRVTADKRDHFIKLGKAVGVDSLRETLALMKPERKPTDVIDQHNNAPQGGQHEQGQLSKLSELTPDAAEKLKAENPKEYARLYKAETGVELAEV
jgi:hypothetical protein